jgi:hypothetical protein
VPAPQPDIYVALLGVALGALVLGCIMLLVVLGRYEFKVNVSARETSRGASLALVQSVPEAKIRTVHL